MPEWSSHMFTYCNTFLFLLFKLAIIGSFGLNKTDFNSFFAVMACSNRYYDLFLGRFLI